MKVAVGAIAALLCAGAVSACGGGSSGDANTLLRQTFSGSHKVNSGDLSFIVSIQPSGSSTISGPITLSFGGPFQSLGQGKLPASNFNVSISALGRTGTLGILSTGTNGYVTLSGTSYQLPAATFQRLESSFSSLASSGSAGSGQSTLSRLGINPLGWLTSPSVVGNESVGGANTTHIHAGVNVAAFLGDISTFLSKASSLGVSGTTKLPTSIAPATRQKIAAEVKNPSFDVWTGTADKTVRKLAVSLTIPVSGQISTLAGGLSSATISLTISYANLNQPQTITAPTSVQPYSQFQAKIKSLLQEIQSAVPGVSGAGGGTTTSTATASTSSNSSNLSAYTQCIQAANGDITKMQQCGKLLGGG